MSKLNENKFGNGKSTKRMIFFLLISSFNTIDLKDTIQNEVPDDSILFK